MLIFDIDRDDPDLPFNTLLGTLMPQIYTRLVNNQQK